MEMKTLPSDMQCMIFQLIEDNGGGRLLGSLERHDITIDSIEHDSLSAIWAEIDKEKQGAKAKNSRWWDYRGQAHVDEMAAIYRVHGSATSALPPVILMNGKWLDGRHRLLAARDAGLTSIGVIHLEKLTQELQEAYEPLDRPENPSSSERESGG